jgi:hypothetical protein
VRTGGAIFTPSTPYDTAPSYPSHPSHPPCGHIHHTAPLAPLIAPLLLSCGPVFHSSHQSHPSPPPPSLIPQHPASGRARPSVRETRFPPVTRPAHGAATSSATLLNLMSPNPPRGLTLIRAHTVQEMDGQTKSASREITRARETDECITQDRCAGKVLRPPHYFVWHAVEEEWE